GTNGAGLQRNSTYSKMPQSTKEMCMPTLAADVLLLTATPVESKATLQAFAAATQHKTIPHSLDSRIYFDLGTVNGARVCLTQSEMGAGGLGATLQTTHKGIAAL